MEFSNDQWRALSAHLLPFLDFDNITEKSMAAQATITIAPGRVIKTLEEVVASTDCYEFSAAYDALAHYRRGETVVYGVG